MLIIRQFSNLLGLTGFGSQPLAPDPQVISVADRNLVPVRCTLKGIEFLGDEKIKHTFHLITQIEIGTDGKLYVIHNREYIHRFNVAGNDSNCILTLDTSFDANEQSYFYKDLMAIAGNTLYTSGHIFNVDQTGISKIGGSCPSDLIVRPDGQSGLGYDDYGSKLLKVILNEGRCESEEWSGFTNMFNALGIITWIGESDFAIGGPLRGGNGRWIVAVFDANGREKLRFGDDERVMFGIDDLEQCGQDYCILNSNLRNLTIWDSRGNLKGTINLGTLFDLSYPWLPDFTIHSGFAWFTTIQERQDTGVKEGNIYRVRGL